LRIDLEQQLVTQIRFDFAVSLLTLQGGVIRVQNDFSVSRPGAEPVVVSIDDIAPTAGCVAELFGQALDCAQAHGDGSLSLSFESGTRLDVAADGADESWSLNSPATGLLVGLPGGIAIHGSDAHA
jgi:hypothetical protein